MFGFHSVSAGPLSTSAAKTVHAGSTTISAVATQSVTFTILGEATLSSGGMRIRLRNVYRKALVGTSS